MKTLGIFVLLMRCGATAAFAQDANLSGLITDPADARVPNAEVIAFNDFVTLGGEARAKEAGKMRLEGKEYIVKDGDVMHFRFNV